MKKAIIVVLLFLLVSCAQKQIEEQKEAPQEEIPKETSVVTESGKEIKIEVEEQPEEAKPNESITGASVTASWCPIGKQENGKVLPLVGKVKSDRTVTGKGIQSEGKYKNLCKITVELPSSENDLSSHVIEYYFDAEEKGYAVIDGTEYPIN